jgi:hypothetical protein
MFKNQFTVKKFKVDDITNKKTLIAQKCKRSKFLARKKVLSTGNGKLAAFSSWCLHLGGK